MGPKTVDPRMLTHHIWVLIIMLPCNTYRHADDWPVFGGKTRRARNKKKRKRTKHARGWWRRRRRRLTKKAPTFSHELLALVPVLVQHLVELGVVRPDLHVHQLVEHGVEEGFVRVERAFDKENKKESRDTVGTTSAT